MDTNKILGVDVGGSGIKAAIVDTYTGELLSERLRVPTPQPSTPAAMAAALQQLLEMHQWESGLIGVGFPAIVRKGVAHSAANIDAAWIGKSIEQIFGEASGCPVFALNDADAAGIAEMYFGLGKGRKGTVLLLTIGTGVGSALFTDGHLVRNSELGHIRMFNESAERYVADSARKRDDLSWDEFGQRFNEYLLYIQRTFFPELVLIGGGISKKFQKYESHFSVNFEVQPAHFKNKAGAIGAAMYAKEAYERQLSS
ncbi:MAG: ROK family protein [Bacteroidota bacterium]